MLTAEFFEKYPLYRKYKLQQFVDNIQNMKAPAIKSFCPVCYSENTFAGQLSQIGKHKDKVSLNKLPTNELFSVADRVVSAKYICASCNDYCQFFLLYFDGSLSSVVKIGQFPAWSVVVEKNLSTMLGEHEEIYRNGLICESQGYGIGAYAYYRRIVESIIDKLLNSIHDLLDEQNKVRYEQALRETQEGIVAQEKIALVKDLVPESLRPGNMNPLSLLHDSLSKGIHTLTDEECLEIASDIREVLTYLVERINLAVQAKKSSHQFTESMKKLLERKSQRP
jgi:hypothetical protein